MKKYSVLHLLILIIFLGFAGGCAKKSDQTTENTSADTTQTVVKEQSTNPPAEDKSRRPSPPDSLNLTVGAAEVKLNYSKPAVKGRKVWGDLVPFGEVWRTGANEATVFETTKDILVQGKKLPAGKYALFTIPDKTAWTVIFNKVYDQWGAFKYDQKEDALRVSANPETIAENVELLSFEADPKTNKIALKWEKLKLAFEVKEAK